VPHRACRHPQCTPIKSSRSASIVIPQSTNAHNRAHRSLRAAPRQRDTRSFVAVLSAKTQRTPHHARRRTRPGTSESWRVQARRGHQVKLRLFRRIHACCPFGLLRVQLTDRRGKTTFMPSARIFSIGKAKDGRFVLARRWRRAYRGPMNDTIEHPQIPLLCWCPQNGRKHWGRGACMWNFGLAGCVL